MWWLQLPRRVLCFGGQVSDDHFMKREEFIECPPWSDVSYPVSNPSCDDPSVTRVTCRSNRSRLCQRPPTCSGKGRALVYRYRPYCDGLRPNESQSQCTNQETGNQVFSMFFVYPRTTTSTKHSIFVSFDINTNFISTGVPSLNKIS